jgi:hypothetical protein
MCFLAAALCEWPATAKRMCASRERQPTSHSITLARPAEAWSNGPGTGWSVARTSVRRAVSARRARSRETSSRSWGVTGGTDPQALSGVGVVALDEARALQYPQEGLCPLGSSRGRGSRRTSELESGAWASPPSCTKTLEALSEPRTGLGFGFSRRKDRRWLGERQSSRVRAAGPPARPLRSSME